MKRYEYMWRSLVPQGGLFDVQGKVDQFVYELNRLGQEGWMLMSGVDSWHVCLFMREIPEEGASYELTLAPPPYMPPR